MGWALLLDLGGTVGVSPLEAMGAYAERVPDARAALARRGPFGTEPDPEWAAVLRGELAEPAYLARRAAEIGRATGRDGDIRSFMRELFTMPGLAFQRPVAAALIADARAAGAPVGVLTNDLAAFGGPAARERIPFLADMDVLVDGSVTGVLKPDPRAYRAAAEELGRPPEQVVFLDDLAANVIGARAVGMTAFHVDIAAPDAAFDAARAALGL